MLSLGAALQILGLLAFKGSEFKQLKKEVKQKVMIAMDLLAGCLAYSVSTTRNEYDEMTRRSFLLTHGKRFIGQARASRLHRTGGKMRNMKAGPDSLLEPAGTGG